jgi:LmbE family N-acetylglucosaminyl deacetylase
MKHKTVLIVAAHADDEVLGCGGTIARHTAKGDVVYVVFLADGVTSRFSAQTSSQQANLAKREKAAKAAHHILGIREAHYLGFPDNRLDSVPLLDVVQALEAVIEKVRPEVIYTHHHGDLNVDHRIAHEAVLTACRPQPDHFVREIYAFEVLSSTEWSLPTTEHFMPQMFVEIPLDKKIEALRAYELEMRAAPHSRSMEHVKALAVHRGMSIGVVAAEAFMIVRIMRRFQKIENYG